MHPITKPGRESFNWNFGVRKKKNARKSKAQSSSEAQWACGVLAVVGPSVCSTDLQRFLLGSRAGGDAILFSLRIFSADDGVYCLDIFVRTGD